MTYPPSPHSARSISERAAAGSAECYGADEIAMVALNASVALSQSHSRLAVQVAEKANATTVVRQLAEKLDAHAVSAQLKSKANSSAVEAELLAKADVTMVTELATRVAGKANESSLADLAGAVTAQLVDKADATADALVCKFREAL